MVKYKTFFNLDQDIDKVKDKADLIRLVKEHFNSFKIDKEKVIENFLKIEKDVHYDIVNNARKSVRNQEKLEKVNINKVLEHINK